MNRRARVRSSREQLIELLNEDLAREYQAIIAYVVYSQVMKGAEYMAIAKELETHASEELEPCADRLEAHRLSRRRADRDGQAGEDVREGRRHAALRPRQRKRDGAELSRARETMRGAGRVRHGRAPAGHSQAGAGTPDRSGDCARRGCARCVKDEGARDTGKGQGEGRSSNVH